jgi:hypothetical protein
MTGTDEIVIASNELTMDVHKSLFHLPDEWYILMNGITFESLSSITKELKRLHLSLNWLDMIRFGTWQEAPDWRDTFLLLKKVGITIDELKPFRDSPVTDILPYLYYGKRFDILRRICAVTKKNIEQKIMGKIAKVNCHLVYEETSSIIASSL